MEVALIRAIQENPQYCYGFLKTVQSDISNISNKVTEYMSQRETCDRLLDQFHSKYLTESSTAPTTHMRNNSDSLLLSNDAPQQNKLVRSMTTTQLNDSLSSIDVPLMQQDHLFLSLAICILFSKLGALYLDIMDLEVLSLCLLHDLISYVLYSLEWKISLDQTRSHLP